MKKRILILDNDEDLLDLLKLIFFEEDLEVFAFSATKDLFTLVRSHSPHVLLLDLGLNGKSGGQWCAQLKSSPEFKHIPVIIYTAFADKSLIKGIYGCDDLINKPFDLVDILERIKTLIALSMTMTLPNANIYSHVLPKQV